MFLVRGRSLLGAAGSLLLNVKRYYGCPAWQWDTVRRQGLRTFARRSSIPLVASAAWCDRLLGALAAVGAAPWWV